MPRPREYDENLRGRLLDTAARLLAEEGPHHVTTRRVAAEVGTSTTAIYSLIGSKDELFRAIFREGFRRFAAHLATVEPTDDPLDDLRRLGDAYHDNAIENPHLYRVMFDCPIPEFSLSDADAAFSLSTLQVLIDAVQRCIDAGCFAGDADELALELWSLNHGFATLAITGMLGDAAQARELRAHASAAIIAGYQQLDAPSGSVRDPRRPTTSIAERSRAAARQ